ncbi:type VI secretion system protein TssL, long form [Bordetella sp. LUAb4]|uniref:type VI secretion system protein TssL, long form n=1 Tax=Bordetella sp. LUAb4 TaxID=2843195 RepID=UPI00351CF657
MADMYASGHTPPALIDAVNGKSEAAAAQDIAPPEAFEDRLALVKNAANSLLEASRVLLRAQADMPETLPSRNAAASLRMILEQELRTFERLCEQANIRRDHMIGARYCLCTALDEAAMQTDWGKGSHAGIEWNSNGLATTFHEDRDGGEKVYLIIGRLLEDAREHLNLLEVIYRILSLGFEGRYRHGNGGKRRHDAIRERIFNEIASQRDAVPLALSARWQSEARSRRPCFYSIPVWMTATLLSLTALGLFGWFKYELVTRTSVLQRQIAEISQLVPAASATPAPAAAPALHLKQLLKDQIAAGMLSVDEDAQHSAVTFRGDTMFQSGGATVHASIDPLIAKIASEIIKVPGKVTIIGHTDNIPIRSRYFPSNLALSQERANKVMQILQSAGVPSNRLEAVGKGETDPVGDNNTAQGRAQNRRVEIVVGR